MAEITRKDFFDTLTEFYGKVVEPRFDRIEKKLGEHQGIRRRFLSLIL